MLFWIFVIILVIGIASLIWYQNCSYKLEELLNCTSAAGLVLGLIAVAASIVVMGFNYIGQESCIASMNERYDMLVYQLENDIYDNDNDLGKRELMVDIQAWNEDLAGKRARQDDFWIGIYVPDIYDQFEFIELEDYNDDSNR